MPLLRSWDFASRWSIPRGCKLCAVPIILLLGLFPFLISSDSFHFKISLMLQPHPPFVFSRHLLVILIIFSVAFVLFVPYFIFFLHLLISNKPAKQSSQEEAEQNSQHWVVFNHFRLSKGVFNGLLMGKLANW